MNPKVPNIILLERFLDITYPLTIEQKGYLLDAILRWRLSEPINFVDPMLSGLWLFVEPMLNDTAENYNKKKEVNQENGKKGGRPKKTQPNPQNPLGSLETHPNPKNLINRNINKNKNIDKNIDKNKLVLLSTNISTNTNSGDFSKEINEQEFINDWLNKRVV